MILQANKFFVFHFWQKNGVSLTESSMVFKESSVKSSLECACFFEMLWAAHVYMIIGKSSVASISKNQDLIKTAQNGQIFYC